MFLDVIWFCLLEHGVIIASLSQDFGHRCVKDHSLFQQLSDFGIFLQYCSAASAAEMLQHESSGKLC